MANRVKLKSLNEHFQCGICQGYIIDATTVSECLHSFCKSCIFHFIESIDNCCPTCNQSLGELNNCISFDSSLQRLIYQLIPNLLTNELDRRNKFQKTQEFESSTILNEDSLVNLKLISSPKTNLKLLELIRTRRLNKIEIDSDTSEANDVAGNNSSELTLVQHEPTTVKYIQCIAQTPIRIICRMLQNKYNIPGDYRVRIYCLGHKLGEPETLLEVYTSFIKSKTDVLELEYKFVKQKPRIASAEFQLESTKLVETLSRSLDIHDANNKKRMPSPKKKDSHDSRKHSTSETNQKPPAVSQTNSKITVKSKKEKNDRVYNESSFMQSQNTKSKELTSDLNETVYYSDEENSSEGKLLIADDSSSSDSKQTAPAHHSKNSNIRKKNSSLCE